MLIVSEDIMLLVALLYKDHNQERMKMAEMEVSIAVYVLDQEYYLCIPLFVLLDDRPFSG